MMGVPPPTKKRQLVDEVDETGNGMRSERHEGRNRSVATARRAEEQKLEDSKRPGRMKLLQAARARQARTTMMVPMPLEKMLARWTRSNSSASNGINHVLECTVFHKPKPAPDYMVKGVRISCHGDAEIHASRDPN